VPQPITRAKVAASLIVALGLLSVVPGTAGANSAIKRECFAAGTRGPKVLSAELAHPGDRKTQAEIVRANWGSLPALCDGHFVRRAAVRFQIQDPLRHRRWRNMGAWVTPQRDLDDAREEAEKEKEAEGKSCYRLGPAGKEPICNYSDRLTNKGGEAYATDPRISQIPQPALKNHERYRCSPGKGVTHARALIRNRVVVAGSGHIVGQRVRMITLKIARVSYLLPRLRNRGRLRGPC